MSKIWLWIETYPIFNLTFAPSGWIWNLCRFWQSGWATDHFFSFFLQKSLFSFWIPFARAKFKSGASFSELTNQRGAWVTFRRLFAFRRLDRPSAISFMLSRLVCEPLLGERKSGRYSPVPERKKLQKIREKKIGEKSKKFHTFQAYTMLGIFVDFLRLEKNSENGIFAGFFCILYVRILRVLCLEFRRLSGQIFFDQSSSKDANFWHFCWHFMPKILYFLADFYQKNRS